MGQDAQSGGKVVPNIATIRRRMGKPGPQTTTTADAARAVRASGYRYYLVRDVAKIRRAVRNGRPVQLAIDYGVLNDELRRTGDPNFRGGHSVLVYGQRRRQGVVEWRLFDSLDDKRRSNIPQGPRWVPRRVLLRACRALGTFAGVFGSKRR